MILLLRIFEFEYLLIIRMKICSFDHHSCFHLRLILKFLILHKPNYYINSKDSNSELTPYFSNLSHSLNSFKTISLSFRRSHKHFIIKCSGLIKSLYESPIHNNKCFYKKEFQNIHKNLFI